MISGGRCVGTGGGGGSRVGRGGDGTSVAVFTSWETGVGPGVVGGIESLSAGLEMLVSLAPVVEGRGGNGWLEPGFLRICMLIGLRIFLLCMKSAFSSPLVGCWARDF